MVRKGDTLIEVTLAIGIFSLVAIAVVSVVNGSTSGAQSSLETTLAREEIDNQAEALRFIQASYINSNTADKTATQNNASDFKYKELWQAIGARAIEPNNMEYRPSTCQELYDIESPTAQNQLMKEKSFVINIRKLGIEAAGSNWTNEVVVPASTSTFTTASTYPRVIYGTTAENGSLVDDGSETSIYRVEGLYVTAVKGPNTVVVSETGSVNNKVATAYYDFYIRSCWYAPGANTPSTISTVMRLYNPDVVKVASPNESPNESPI